jgi:3-oxoacyl-[acyl-carrier protein] reductase
MKGRLADKVALITGAASGIGRATALAFADEGAKVAAVDLRIDGCDQVVAQIKERDGEAIAIKCDLVK